MKKQYKEALAEVDIILENTEEELVNKIPHNFKKFIKENKEKNHTIKLQNNKTLMEQNIKQETKQILALLYRDYICSKEEKKELIRCEQEEREKIEAEKKEKFKIDFGERKQRIGAENLETEKQALLIKNQKEKWYQKIINKILQKFKINKS